MKTNLLMNAVAPFVLASTRWPVYITQLHTGQFRRKAPGYPRYSKPGPYNKTRENSRRAARMKS